MAAHINYGFLLAAFCWTLLATVSGQASSVTASETPVLRIQPVPRGNGTSDSLIQYRSTSETGYGNWTRSLEAFLHDYRLPGLSPSGGRNIYNCDYETPPPRGGVCDVDVGHWFPCVADNHFGYHRASPCIFLTLDTPLGWEPEFYNDINSLPEEMPLDLKSHIRSIASSNSLQLNTVWVSCEGVYPADVEFIGAVNYIPRHGIPGYYFLNNNADGYLSPIIAVYFERPSSGILINIKCKAWARNIDNTADATTQGGQFSLLID